MHDREGGGLEFGEAADRGCGLGRETRGTENVLGLRGGVEEIVRGDGWSGADLGEEVTAEQCAGGLFVEDVRVPAAEAMASDTSGNMARGPVWKMSGSSASIRN